MSRKSRIPLYRGLTTTMLSLVVAFSAGYAIADTWRSTVDKVLGTKSFVTDTTNIKYKSTYKTADQLIAAAKALSIQEGAEGTVIMRNTGSVLPLKKTAKVGVWGTAGYNPYMVAAGNSDQVKLVPALKAAGISVDSTLEAIYTQLATHSTTTQSGWSTVTTYDYGPNFSAGDYNEQGYQIVEADPDTDFVAGGNADANWKSSVSDDVAIVVFARPGGEGTTYHPGIARDKAGNTLNQNPLAFSPEELKTVAAAKSTAKKVVVLLNTSCAFEVGPLIKDGSAYQVDGLAYIGIPNDYQFTGIVQALVGDVNPSGALADTYAYSSTANPAMMNFGGGYYSDYESIAATGDAATGYNDPRWSGTAIANTRGGSFGGSATYSGGHYIVEAEGIFTGYSYYESRYYDTVVNQFNAASTAGVSQGEATWKYSDEVAYSFGYGLSYLDYTESLESVSVENRAGGDVVATIKLTNKGTSEGRFNAQLYVQAPYSEYDKANLVEKSAIQFLSSAKVTIKAGASENVTIKVPSKYLASYDYKKAKTYVLDGGTYYFATGKGSHDAVNNVLTAQGKTGDAAGDSGCVKSYTIGTAGTPDTTTFAVSDSGAKITNVVDNADLNYYLPGSVKYLTRQDWNGSYPVNYNTANNGTGFALASSTKKEEWTAELRNQQYTIKDDGTAVSNVNGVAGTSWNDIGYDQQTNIKDPVWDKLVAGISVDQAIGAVAHGGSASDKLSNVNNPVVTQNDGPTGFNGKALSTNNGASASEDPYFVDATTDAGKFKPGINSQTLLGSSFSPEIAYAWGQLLGNTGLWIGNYEIWGAALNYHRTQYNGRNTEYPSEDPMLSNIIGEGIIRGSKEFGVIVGPKHIGFNDQEYDRAGICVYMNEQKFRETDLRGFQGAIEDAGALGLMVAFNRIGAINASHHVGFLMKLVRGEWNFRGLSSTDMMNNAYYFNPESCIMAGITMMADFAANNSTISGGKTGSDATWAYINLEAAKKDSTLVAQAREDLKYQLYAFANSAVLNLSTVAVTPAWETGLKVGLGISIGLSAVAGCLWIAESFIFPVLARKKEVA